MLAVVGQTSWNGPFFVPPTQPAGSAWFPSVPQSPGNSAGDGYVAVFNDLNQLRWSTRIGGSYGEDHASVAVDNGKIVMMGSTSSPDFPAILDGGPFAYDQAALVPDYFPGELYLLSFDYDFDLEWGTFLCSWP
jgi:hypothetical protein